MWPFKSKPLSIQKVQKGGFMYSCLDVTETFNDNLHLTKDQWVKTIPLNELVVNGERMEPKVLEMGIPPAGTDEEETYKTAAYMSDLRADFKNPTDGVYCPICHIANIDSSKFNKACPKCGRKLLRFGWD